MQILVILAAASLAFAKVLPLALKDQGCIFKATKSADLKSSFYRENCRKNLEEAKYGHWLLEEDDGHLIWREYNGDDGMKQQILKSDCDHILESQVLFNYIHNGNPDALCPQFDEEKRSEQVRAILNGPENMRFINKQINMAKGQIFGPKIGKLSSIIKRHKENHFAEALDEYIYNVQPSFHATESKINQIFADFLKAHPKFHSQFNGTFLARSNQALATAHHRLEEIISGP